MGLSEFVGFGFIEFNGFLPFVLNGVLNTKVLGMQVRKLADLSNISSTSRTFVLVQHVSVDILKRDWENS